MAEVKEMSSSSFYDLDQLNGESFQELCATIMLDEFTPLATPYGTSGPDGGFDGRHRGLLITYTELLDNPHQLFLEDGTEVLWAFQAKHTRKERDIDRQKSVISSLKDEIFKWLDEREQLPTCFILMTNVRLTPSTRKELEEIGLIFEYFDCWDEAKIAAFIALKDSVRITFFPDKDDRAIQEIRKENALYQELKRTTSTMITTPKESPGTVDFFLAIDKLISYEKSFTERNNNLANLFNSPIETSEEIIKYPILEIKASSKGLLNLSDNKEPLEKFIDHIRLKNVFILNWSVYVGEDVDKDNLIMRFYCHKDHKEDLENFKDQIFVVLEGKNNAHEDVNEYVADIQSKIVKSIDEGKYTKTRELLSDFYKIRREYLKRKIDNPDSIYPNTRSISGRVIFGWDFMSLWEDVFEDISDKLLRENHPENLLSTLLVMPFALCKDTISPEYSVKYFNIEFSLVQKLLYILNKESKQSYLDQYFESFKELCHDICEFGYRLDSIKDAKRLQKLVNIIVSSVCKFNKSTLDGDLDVSHKILIEYIDIITNVDIESAITNNISDKNWEKDRAEGERINCELSLKKKEYFFSWATYLWFKIRNKQEFDYSSVHEIEKSIPIKDLVLLYEKTKNTNSDWFIYWFIPEETDRRHSCRTSSIDHDIRELIICSLLNRKFESREIEDFSFLDSQFSVNKFKEDIEYWHATLLKPKNSKKSILKLIDKARVVADEKVKKRVTEATVFDEKKIDRINKSFTENILNDLKEGSLYSIKEGLIKKKVSHYVGTYTIEDKIWYLQDEGSVSHSVGRKGSFWAKNITAGRMQLILEFLKNNLEEKFYKKSDLIGYLNSLKKDKKKYCLITHHRTIPWEIQPELIEYKQKDSNTGNEAWIGNTRLIYNGRSIVQNELFLIPWAGLRWSVLKKCKKPTIELIDPKTKIGNEIAKQNPKMDISQKVLIEAREFGTVEAELSLKAMKRLKFT